MNDENDKKLNKSKSQEFINKLNKDSKEIKKYPILAHDYKNIKNSNSIEIELNQNLLQTIKRMPMLLKSGGNSFRRHKLALFEILGSMNEFKDRIK